MKQHRISSVVFFLCVVSSAVSSVCKGEETYEFVLSWPPGGPSSHYPIGVAVDTEGFVYVVDSYWRSPSIRKLDSEGNFLPFILLQTATLAIPFRKPLA